MTKTRVSPGPGLRGVPKVGYPEVQRGVPKVGSDGGRVGAGTSGHPRQAGHHRTMQPFHLC